MKKLLSASFLVAGTAIGVGLIALPLMAVNLGLGLASALIAFMVFMAYQSSMMTLDLNARCGEGASIVEMSQRLSGRKAFGVCLLSFYALSLSLLTAYFAGVADSLKVFLGLNPNLAILLCAVGLFIILCLKLEVFARLNSLLVVILLAAIVFALVKIHVSSSIAFPKTQMKQSELFAFFPVIFTSFGVQNICPYIYDFLHHDRRKINLSFLIGILIPALIYISWIYFVFENVLSRDPAFFAQLQQHQVSAGELVKFLCESSSGRMMALSFKVLSLLAILTSAIGIGLGLLKSIQEVFTPSHRLASAAICLVPVVLVLLVPNAFLSVLSFGGMIATVFVIFMPYYLSVKEKRAARPAYHLCFIFGIFVVLCELLGKFF